MPGSEYPFSGRLLAVSYTHLDVYKRQEQPSGNQHPQVMGVNGDQRQDGRRGGCRRQLDTGGDMVQPAGNDAPHHQLSLIHI